MQTNSKTLQLVSRQMLTATFALAAVLTSTAADYPNAVLADAPLAYYRLGETAPVDIARNSGSLGATGNGTNRSGVTLRLAGALAGSGNAAAAYDGNSGGTVIPYSGTLNPQGPFTVELWVKPNTIPNSAGTPCPISSAQFNGNRSGWQIRERDTGYQFVLYNNVGSGVANNGLANTANGGVPSTTTWTHLVGVYDGTDTYLYVNGVQYSSSAAGYVANNNAGGTGPLTVGIRSSLDNAFNGFVDEVAIYGSALSSNQVFSHYANGTNAARSTPYESLVAADGAVEYLRLDEASLAVNAAVNYGSLGPVADAIHTPGVRHPVSGPLAGNAGETAASYVGILDADGGQPTYVPATQNLRIRELWDNVGIGLINGLGNGTTSVGLDGAASWQLNAETMITVAQDFDIETLPGPPYALGHRGGVWRNGGDNWNTTSWATRQLTTAAQINFNAAGEYWITMRVNNSGDTAMGVGFASGADGSAEFVGVGVMWDNATALDSGNAANSLYVSSGTLGQDLAGNNDGPCAIQSYSPAGTINARGLIVARLTTTIGGANTLVAQVFPGGSSVPADPSGFSWQVTNNFSSTITATHLLVWLNGGGQGELDAIRVAASFNDMFTDSLKALNPAGSFTIEAWVKPTVNGFGNAQCPLHNRAATQGDGGGNRSGWDFFQRDQSVGWQFRMFNGAGGARVFDPQGGPYTVGQWHHLVAVHDASVPSATLYLNGVSVAADNTPDGTFAPKTFGDLAIGSFSQPWMNPQGYENAFEGSIGQVAIYTNALSLSRIQAHYNNATNPSPATPYSAVVLSDGPVGYWRLNEGPHNLSTNLGSLATAADGVYVNTANGVAGPQAPAYAGFAADNKAKTFNGSSSYVELLNPSGLNFTGQITVEAWVQPSASLNAFANVLAHGVNRGDNAELVLRLTDANSYLFAAWDGANHGSGTAVPAGDLGSTNWVYLAGTYDGANWNLYRNGALAATVADGTGAVLVNDAAWAIGARGRWAQAYGYDAGALFPNRQFTGGIDEPAIYSTALTPAQIQAHWLVGKYGTTTPPVPTLTIQASGSDVILTWSAGVLLEATDVNGPYTEVSGATSAYTVAATAAQKYYRVRL